VPGPLTPSAAPTALPLNDRPWSPAEGGYSLVEGILVVAILAILTGIAVPRFDTARPIVDGAVLSLNAVLMTVQRTAMLRQHDVRVVFQGAERRLLIHRDADNDGELSAGESTRVEELPDGAVFGRAGAPALRGGSADITFREGPEGAPELVYHRNGSVSQQGVVHLTHASDGRPAATRAIEISRATGLAACHSYETGNWEEGC